MNNDMNAPWWAWGIIILFDMFWAWFMGYCAGRA